MQKHGQVSLFIIIAIVIVAIAVFSIVYFKPFGIGAPSKAQLVENYLKDCVDVKVKDAVKIAGMQAGYLEVPSFEPGSSYMPFSNQLDFLGTGVPYWYYVSGNNIVKMQKPDIATIESQFADYVKKRIAECDFSSFSAQGYNISFADLQNVNVKINGASMDTTVNWPMTVSFGTETSTVSEHKVSTKTSFGLLYDRASKIYNFEQNNLFLENYSLDVIQLYAPVDGIELTCAPKIWQKSSVANDLKTALAANVAMLKVSGSYYSLARAENKYFVVDTGEQVSERVSFLYSSSWPTRLEIWPTQGDTMRADPIGTQPGLNVLGAVGFCYVPYHFVYDLYHPVLVQVSEDDELFQFPVIVVIDKTLPRNASAIANESQGLGFDICQYKIQGATIISSDDNSKPLEAEILFKCINQVCDLGQTTIKQGYASLDTNLPQCFNGFIIAQAPGYKDAKVQVNTTGSFVTNIFLSARHPLAIEMPNLKSDEYAVITFVSSDDVVTVSYPDQNQINLSEGYYNVTVYLYKQSSITLQAQRVNKCIEVPAGGVQGVFGAMQEQCYDLDVPQETLTNVLFGGGKTQYLITKNDLEGASKISIVAQTFNVPSNLADLGDLYGLVDISDVSIQLK